MNNQLTIGEQTFIHHAIIERLETLQATYKIMTGQDKKEFKPFLDEQIKRAQSIALKTLDMKLVRTNSGWSFRSNQ